MKYLETGTTRIQCAKNYEYQFKFL